MVPFDECCVLIPVSTLEDFPSKLSDPDARSLLAAWTVLWHPSLLARTEQIPVWYRADSPPDPIGKRLFTVPLSSKRQLPGGYETRVQSTEGSYWVTGESREQMLQAIGAMIGEQVYPPSLTHAGRTIGIEDFFAAGYASLQVRVMTRRLRYTSNLDEIYLQKRVLAAAKFFNEGAAADAIQSLHEVFDCLAEERDHYFSSDPHLIDLTLSSVSTLPALLSTVQQHLQHLEAKTAVADASPVIATPLNVLIDGGVAAAIGQLEGDQQPLAQQLKAALQSQQIGWAGGGPADDVCLDALSLREAESLFVAAHQQATHALGTAPPVFGRFAGATPSDMIPTLLKLGYCGMIPLDFANGTGHGDEAKVIMQSIGGELEALTAKPLDAASDASFLTLGTSLGEAIDTGAIATALLVHWPGQSCDSFQDLLRVSSWSLCLGRFWKLGDYFRDGEHPYHHGSSSFTSSTSAQLLQSVVDSGSRNPLSTLATKFCSRVASEQSQLLAGMTGLITRKPVSEQVRPHDFASAVIGKAAVQGESVLIINPNSIGARTDVALAAAPAADKHIFASSGGRNANVTTVDVPAFGFVILRPGEGDRGPRVSMGQRIRNKFLGVAPALAESGRMHNEFMDVTISAESGGISGVYSGSVRGNRFSLRLVCNRSDSVTEAKAETKMLCDRQAVIESSASLGCIESTGRIVDQSDVTLAKFVLRYTLRRGSRILQVTGSLDEVTNLGDKPWQDYVAARIAVADEGAVFRSLIRDKIHRSRSRRMVSPLGVLIDETERQTLIGSGGLAFHHRYGDRFLDTLLAVNGETKPEFTLSYGFDVPSPIAAARALIEPAIQLPIVADSASIGWIMHTAPNDVLVSDLKVDVRDDGKLVAIFRLIQTRPQPCKAIVRFLHNVRAAFIVNQMNGGGADINRELPVQPAADAEAEAGGESTAAKTTEASWLKTQADQLLLSMPGHGVVDVIVVFE